MSNPTSERIARGAASASAEAEVFTIALPIRRVDEERREVWGWAATDRVGLDNKELTHEANVDAFARWAGNIREMHQLKAVGTAIHWEPDDANRRIYLGARISRGAEDTWQKCLDGTLKCFSVNGTGRDVRSVMRAVNGVQRSVRQIRKYDLGEVSLVDSAGDPAVGTFVDIVRALDVADEGELEPPADLIARASASHEPYSGTHSHEHAANGAQGDDDTHDHSHYHDGDAAHDHSHENVKRAEPTVVLVEPDADLAIERVAWAERGVEIIFRRDYTTEQRVEMAKNGKAIAVRNDAGDIVDGRYPIEDEEDLKNAVRAYGRASDKAEVKEHITKRAKALGKTPDLPDDWTVTRALDEQGAAAAGEPSDELADAELAGQAIDVINRLIAREALQQVAGSEEGWDISLLMQSRDWLLYFQQGERSEANSLVMRSKEAAVDVSELETALTEARNQITELVERVGRVETEQAEVVQRAADPLAADIKAVVERVDKLETQPAAGGPMRTIPEDFESPGAVERALAVVRAAMPEQADEINTITAYAQMREAQRKPLGG